MKEITNELLESLGFKTNHPDYILKRYVLASDEKPAWRLNVESSYITGTNNLGWMVNCWKENESGFITKRATLNFVNDYEDVIKLCNLCDINIPGN